MMGRQKRDGNHSLCKNKLVPDSKGKEENRHPLPDTNKTKMYYPNEPNEAHKNTMKEEIPQEITENFMEILLDKVNHNVQKALKKFQDNKNKEHEKTEKQVSEFTGALNK
jgi:gas vesicle protein